MKRNAKFLKEISESTPNKRKYILKTSTDEHIQALSEIAHNLLKGNIKLDNKEHRAIKRWREQIRKLAHVHTSFKKKRKNLIQCGGNFLPKLVKPVLKFIVGVATSVIANSIV